MNIENVIEDIIKEIDLSNLFIFYLNRNFIILKILTKFIILYIYQSIFHFLY